jgi:hypothetical protein
MFVRAPVVQGLATILVWAIPTVDVSAQPTVPAHSLLGLLNDLTVKVNTAAAGVPSLPIGPTDNLDIAVLMALEVSTAPLGTSSGSFTFKFDGPTGIFVSSTRTFGPAFAQRSLTSGKGKVNAGFQWLHAHYDSLSGLGMLNGDLRPVQNVRTAEGPAPVSYSSIKVNATSDINVGFLSYGVINDLDVGVAVPWIRVSLGADAGLFSATNQDLTPGGHLLVIPHTSASGVGDIAVFAKHHLWHQGDPNDDGGLAAGVELRFPTGDMNNLRGTGVTRTLFSAIWSHGGIVSPHANIGYEYWSKKIQLTDAYLKDQINYAFGAEIRSHRKATITVDIVGRRLLNGGASGYRTVPLFPGVIGEVLRTFPQSLDVVSAAPGVKWNVAANVILAGNVLASITNGGLRSNLTSVVGFEWAF